jgi:uncharacterized membrane protein
MAGEQGLAPKVAFWALVVAVAAPLLVAVAGVAGASIEPLGRDNFIAGMVVAAFASWLLMGWALVIAFRMEAFSVGDRRTWLVLILVTGPIAATMLLFRRLYGRTA